jgi:endoglucanase
MTPKHLLIIAFLLLALAACSQAAQPTAMPTIPAARPTATPFPTYTPSPLPQFSPTPAGPMYEAAHRLGRGVNLGNALEAPTEGEWGVTLQEHYFPAIRQAGFDSVRIPIRFSAHALAEAPYTIDAVFFERVDWAVNNAIQNDLVAIIDMHHYLEVMEDPAGHRQRFIGLWQQIAERYQDAPTDQVYFEILNEPNTNLYGDIWNQLLADTLTVVRQSNPERPIIVSPGGWGGTAELELLTLPEEDRNLIVTFHYYLPFHFTHQGAEWVDGSEAWLGTTWKGTNMERRLMNGDFLLVADWAARHQRPIFLGEFGAYSKAEMEDRLTWTDAVARLAEQYGYSWAYWEFCAGFGVYDPETETWREPLLKALIPTAE